MFVEDFEKAQTAMDAIPVPVANINAVITNATELEVPVERKAWKYRDWEKNDATGLADLKVKNLVLVQTMYKEQYGVDMSE